MCKNRLGIPPRMRSIRQKVLGCGDFFKSPRGLCGHVGSVQCLPAPQNKKHRVLQGCGASARSFAGLRAFSKAPKVFWYFAFPLTISASAFGNPFPGSVVVPMHFPPDEQAGERAPLEGDEGIEVAGSGGRPVGGQED